MNPQRAERVIQILSVAGIWFAFAVVWFGAVGYMRMYLNLDSEPDLPESTLVWLAMGQSGFAFLVPAALTLIIAWLMKVRSPHAGWVAGTVLGIALLYVAGALVAVVLPNFKA